VKFGFHCNGILFTWLYNVNEFLIILIFI
jgi:hypothetical protein